MALTKCKECGAAVSKTAKACPSCGAKQGGGSGGILAALIILLGIILALSGGGGESYSSETASVSSEDVPHQNINRGGPADPTPAYMLVCNDTGELGISDSDPRIARYQNAIDTIRTRFKISETVICDQTWAAADMLRKKNLKTSAIEIMEGVVGLKDAEELGISYAEILASVMTIMQSKSTR